MANEPLPKERRKVKPVSVGSATHSKPDAAKKWVVIHCKGEDGLGYEAWGDELVAHIEASVGVEMDAEVTLAPDKRNEGQTINKITQIWVKGVPVRSVSSRGPGGSTPEDRASNENRTRAQVISDLWIAGKIGDDDPFVKWLKGWLSAQPPVAQPQQTAKPAESTATKHQPTAPASAATAPPSEPAPPPAPSTASKVHPVAEWVAITEADVPDYFKLEPLMYKLAGIQPKDLYARLGGGTRAEQSVSAWAAFQQLKEEFYPG